MNLKKKYHYLCLRILFKMVILFFNVFKELKKILWKYMYLKNAIKRLLFQLRKKEINYFFTKNIF